MKSDQNATNLPYFLNTFP